MTTPQSASVVTTPPDSGLGTPANSTFDKIKADIAQLFVNPVVSQSVFVGSDTAPYFTTLTPVVSGGYLGPVPGQVGFGWKANMTGTITGQEYYANDFFLRDDQIVSNNIKGAFHVMHKFGGAAAGTHHGLDVDVYQTSVDANGAGSNFFTTGIRTIVNIVASDGGTAPTPNGKAFALNGFVQLASTASFMQQAIGGEIDVAVATGASTRDKIGFQICEKDGGASVGAGTFGAALSINSDTGVAGWQTGGGFGICFGSYSGFWPMNASGTLIGGYPNQGSGAVGTTAYGVDFAGLGNGGHAITFTGAAFASTGFQVSGTGQVVGQVCTVATLPTGILNGHVMVTDSNATMTAGIGAIVAGGGANKVPVYYDGTNWRIG